MVLIDEKEESASTFMCLGMVIYTIKITFGKGGQLARAVGDVAILIARGNCVLYFIIVWFVLKPNDGNLLCPVLLGDGSRIILLS